MDSLTPVDIVDRAVSGQNSLSSSSDLKTGSFFSFLVFISHYPSQKIKLSLSFSCIDDINTI